MCEQAFIKSASVQMFLRELESLTAPRASRRAVSLTFLYAHNSPNYVSTSSKYCLNANEFVS